MRSEPNITRVDHGRTHGWWVRVYRGSGDDKTCHSKLFSDATNGGKRKALALARKHRDALLDELPESAPGRKRLAEGDGYVERVEIKRRVGTSWVWRAWMRGEGRRARSSSYSIGVWGEREAKRKAQAWLVEARRELGLATADKRWKAAAT